MANGVVLVNTPENPPPDEPSRPEVFPPMPAPPYADVVVFTVPPLPTLIVRVSPAVAVEIVAFV
jgi:hypothetical protein